ncbi:bacteriocin-like protein [Chryseobacterium sp. G0186]|uniref:bacteriocin-like protein n=1 Tax=Chryseobacterium sp. G0186 TaxID=2487064 RepID=UPI000F4EF176|nr:protein with bacteriocin-type signal sequence [Chryseobacterium sp. G0186]
MKNLKRLTKRELKTIAGGERCPIPASWCFEWCGWTAWQKAHCINAVIDEMPCNC